MASQQSDTSRSRSRSRSLSSARSASDQESERSQSPEVEVEDDNFIVVDYQSSPVKCRRTSPRKIERDPKDPTPMELSGTSVTGKLNLNFPTSEQSARWHRESGCERSKRNSKGEALGFGSWMNRLPGNYSRNEFQVPQGHDDRVRTADCHRVDQLTRQAEGDDSELE